MRGQDAVGHDLGGSCGGVQQADGALDGVGSQRRAGAGDVDELGQEQDDDVDAGLLTGDGDGGAAHMEVDVGEAPLDGAQDLVAGAEERHRGDVLRQDQGADDVGPGTGGGADAGNGLTAHGTVPGGGAARGRLGGRGEGVVCHRAPIVL